MLLVLIGRFWYYFGFPFGTTYTTFGTTYTIFGIALKLLVVLGSFWYCLAAFCSANSTFFLEMLSCSANSTFFFSQSDLVICWRQHGRKPKVIPILSSN